MLDTKDIEILRGMFRENNEIFGAQLKREIRDEMYSVVKASEASLIRRMDSMKDELLTRMDSMKKEIIDGVIDVIDDGVLPQIEELQQDVITVKRHLKLA